MEEVNPGHLIFGQPIRLRKEPMLIRSAEEALRWLHDDTTPAQVKQALAVPRRHLYQALNNRSQKEADDVRNQIVRTLDGMKLTGPG